MNLIYSKYYLNSKIIGAESGFEKLYNIKEIYIAPNGKKTVVDIIHEGQVTTLYLLTNPILLKDIDYSYCAFSVREGEPVNIYYSY